MILKIEEINGETTDIDLVVKVTSLKKRESQNSTGASSIFYYGIVGDETGSIPFTAWQFPQSIREGDIVHLSHCYTRTFRDSLRLYVDSRSEVVLVPDEDIEVKRTYRNSTIRDIKPGDLFVTVEGLIEDPIEKTYEKDGVSKKVLYFTLRDETGSIRVSSFGKSVMANQVVRIVGAKVSEYRGRKRLTIFENTQVIPISREIRKEAPLYDISELSNPIDSVGISGLIVNLSDKSGLMSRCKTCRKKVIDIKCPEHPDDGIFYDLFASFVISDGTGEINATAGASSLGPILGITQENLDPETSTLTKMEVFTRLKSTLTGKPLYLVGDVVRTDDRVNFRAREILIMNKEKLAEVLKKAEEGYEI